MVEKCDSAYCDMVWLLCIHRQGKHTLKFKCCDAPLVNRAQKELKNM